MRGQNRGSRATKASAGRSRRKNGPATASATRVAKHSRRYSARHAPPGASGVRNTVGTCDERRLISATMALPRATSLSSTWPAVFCSARKSPMVVCEEREKLTRPVLVKTEFEFTENTSTDPETMGRSTLVLLAAILAAVCASAAVMSADLGSAFSKVAFVHRGQFTIAESAFSRRRHAAAVMFGPGGANLRGSGGPRGL